MTGYYSGITFQQPMFWVSRHRHRTWPMYLTGSTFAPIGISIERAPNRIRPVMSSRFGHGYLCRGQDASSFFKPDNTTSRYCRATCDLTHPTHVSFFDKMGALLSLPLLAVPSLSTVRYIETEIYALKTPQSRPGPVFHRLLLRASTMRLTC